MSLYTSVQSQIKQAYSYISWSYSPNLLEKLLLPDQILEVSIPVKMDDGSIKVFTGYRSQHNNTKWPYKGGIRFHQNVSKDEVMSLSAWMTLKTSVVWLPLWWGKWGVIVDPKHLSQWELERLSRGYMRKIVPFIGPMTDIPAPDVNTNPQIMAWMLDEYNKISGILSPGVITGKPLALWWSLWRWTATSMGAWIVLLEYLKQTNQSLEGKTIAIQWAGNAWLTFAKIAYTYGAKIVAISDSHWAIYEHEGIDIQEIEALKKDGKSVIDYCQSCKKLTNNELFALDVDILVPAALESVIHKDNAYSITASIILELANGPIDPDADYILEKNNIIVIPDVLANAGWVTVSYFEQIQNNTNYYWSEQEVDEKLKNVMKPATQNVVYTAQKYDISLRMAAYVVSLDRILQAMQFLE
jgi:glutamate dehydrogenase